MLPAIIPARFFFDTTGFEVCVEVGVPDSDEAVVVEALIGNDVLENCPGITVGAWFSAGPGMQIVSRKTRRFCTDKW